MSRWISHFPEFPPIDDNRMREWSEVEEWAKRTGHPDRRTYGARRRQKAIEDIVDVPFDPLEEWLKSHVEGMGDRGEGGIYTVLSKATATSYFRAKKKGSLSVVVADRLAIALHVHPSSIWSDWFTLTKED